MPNTHCNCIDRAGIVPTTVGRSAIHMDASVSTIGDPVLEGE